MRKSTKMEQLVRLARHGPLRARDLAAANIPRTYLSRLRETGIVEQVDRGLYRLIDAQVTELHSIAEVGKRVPHAVVALLSALQLHGLTTEIPHAVWIMIDSHARKPSVTYPPLQVVRASGKALTYGVTTRIIEGVPVRLTTPAKTVADCFRYRRHVGLDVAVTALRDYLRRDRNAVNVLTSAAKADRIYPFMRPYLEALVS